MKILNAAIISVALTSCAAHAEYAPIKVDVCHSCTAPVALTDAVPIQLQPRRGAIRLPTPTIMNLAVGPDGKRMPWSAIWLILDIECGCVVEVEARSDGASKLKFHAAKEIALTEGELTKAIALSNDAWAERIEPTNFSLSYHGSQDLYLLDADVIKSSLNYAKDTATGKLDEYLSNLAIEFMNDRGRKVRIDSTQSRR